MEHATKPALVPCLGILLGTAAGHGLGLDSSVPPLAPAALLASALALGGPSARFVIPFALALWQAALQPPRAEEIAERIDSHLPVTVVGRVDSHPRWDGDEIRCLVRVTGLGQKETMRATRFELWLSAGSLPESVERGSRIRARGYLRRSTGAWNVPATKEGSWRLRLKSEALLTPVSQPGAIARTANRWRRALERRLEATDGRSKPERALARALVLGDRGDLPLAWQQVLRRHGLGHLLAVSGLHLGLVALAVLLLASPLPPLLRYGLVLLALAGYTGILGPRPSVLRAGCMGALGCLALGLQRKPQALNALCCGVAALVGLDPDALFDLGLQLSAAATAGILLLGPALEDRWQRIPGVLRRPLAATVAAQVCVLPWTWPLEAGIHPAAPLGNLVAVSWLLGALLSAWGFLLAPSAWPGLTALALRLLEIHAGWIEALEKLPAHRLYFWPWHLSSGLVILLVSGGLLFLGSRSRIRWGWLMATLVLLLVSRPPSAGVELRLLDVGQGDAIVLRDGRRAVLVDGGGWPDGDLGGKVLVPALAGAGIDRLEAVVMTHADRDHCGGLVDVVRYLEVGQVWMSVGWLHAADCAARLAAVPGPELRLVGPGDRLRVGRWGVEILSPGPGGSRRGNDDSLVLLASAFGRRVLLTGDLEAPGERRLLLHRGPGLRADVLKVAHHGSRTSTSETWLRAVRPRWALVSAGRRNPYGHPAPAVLERLEERGARVLRTDLSGQIVLRFGRGGEMALSLPSDHPPENSRARAARR